MRAVRTGSGCVGIRDLRAGARATWQSVVQIRCAHAKLLHEPAHDRVNRRQRILVTLPVNRRIEIRAGKTAVGQAGEAVTHHGRMPPLKTQIRERLLLDNERMNVLVGDNDSGKSTILEAINLALSGVFHGRFLRNDLSEHVFNREAVEAYVADPKTGPPELLIELYFAGEGVDEYKGNGNSRKDQDAAGIRFSVRLDERYRENANVLLVEEPENHLSHSRLNQLIDMMSAANGTKQIVMTTHGSFVANKANLSHLIMLHDGKTTRLSELDPGNRRETEEVRRRGHRQRREHRRIEEEVRALSRRGRQKHIRICFDDAIDARKEIDGESFNFNTLEPRMLAANGRDMMNAILGTAFDSEKKLVKHMRASKTDSALKIFTSGKIVAFPAYVMAAIED